MAGLTQLGLALIFVSIVFLLAVTFELFYVLLYRRRFQREPPGADDPEVAAAAAAATGDPYGNPSPKELLLYFICLRNESQNERALATVTPIHAVSPSAPGFSWPLRGSAVPDAKPLPPPLPPRPFPPLMPAQLAKWGELYAPQVVFTVGGGEQEDAAKKEPVVVDAEAVVSAGETEEEEEKEEAAAATAEGALEVVPSSTPGCSSRFFTPSMSPLRGEEAVVSAGEAAEDEQKEGVGRVAVEGVLAASLTTGCSSRFYTPSMSPLRRAEAGWELELSLEADGSASDEEGFMSSDEKLPTD